MKPTTRFRSFLFLVGSSLLTVSAHAATYYWDNNGTGANYGTAAGTWSAATVGSATQGWTTATNGTTAPTGSITTLNTNATTDAVNFGNGTSGLSAGTIIVSGTVASGNMTFASGSGAIVLSGGQINFAAASTITVNNASDTITSILGGAATSLTKAGTGTLLLTGANSYSGQTIVSGGTLNLGGGTNTGSLTSTVLTLGGGAFNYTRTGSTTQNFATTNINSAASTISVVSGNTLNLGTVTRGTGIRFDFSGTGAGTLAAATASNVGGIMSGFTFGDSWAVATGTTSAITTLGSYTLTSAAGTAAANYTGFNIDADSSAGALSAAITANSLRFSAAAANTVTLTGTTNVITTGGILVGSAVGSNLSTITGGTLAGANTKDLSVIQNNTSGGLNISSIIADNTGATALVKSGAGTLTLGGNNTFTGGLSIYAGKVVLANAGALRSNVGTENAVAFTAGSTGTLALGGNSVVVRSLSNNGGSPIVENASATPATLTIGNSGNAASTWSGVIRDGTGGGALTLAKSGTGKLDLYSANTYTGGTTINSGTIEINNAGSFGGSGIITFAGNGTIQPVHSSNPSLANGIQVNPGVTGTLYVDNQFFQMTYSGPVTGSGTLVQLNGGGGATGTVTLSSAANTFTGILQLAAPNTKTSSLTVNSLADSANPIRFTTSLTGAATGNNFILGAGTATPLLFNSRQIELASTTGTAGIYNNNATVSNTIIINTNLLITVNGAKTLLLGGSNIGANTFSGTIGNSGAGATSFTKADGGRWILSNTASTYTGATNISAGILEVTKLADGSSNSSIGASTGLAANLVFGSGATLRYTGSGDTTNRAYTFGANANSVGFTINSSGTGALELTNTAAITNSFTGGSQIRFYTLTGTNTNNNIQAATITNNGANAANLTKGGSGKWVLTSANSFTGGLSIQSGILELRSSASNLTQSIGSLNTSVGEGTLISNKSGAGTLSTTLSGRGRNSGGSVNFVSNGGTNGTDNSVLITGGAQGFIDKGSFFNGADFAAQSATNGFVRALAYGTDPNAPAVGTITAANHAKITASYSGAGVSLLSLNLAGSGVGWTNSSGNLTVPGIIKSGGGSLATISGGAINPSATELVIRTDTASDLLSISSNLTQGAGALTKSGAGTLTLSGSGNSYTGETHVNAGILSIGANVHLGAQATGAILNLKGGTLQATGTFGLYNVNPGTNNRPVTLLNQSGIDVTGSNTLTIAGVISNNTAAGTVNPGFDKTGTGTLALTAANSYTGATAVNAGTLAVNGSGAINSSSALTVAANAKLLFNSSTALTVAPTLQGNTIANRAVLGGTGTINASVTLNNVGDVLSPGNSPGIQNFTPAQTWSSFSYDWEINDFSDTTGLTAGSDFDQIGIGSTLNLTGGSGAYILNVLGLTAGNVAGLVPNFGEIDRSWTILTSAGTLTGFNALNWTINTAGFTDPYAGTWSLGQSGNNLVLSYAAVPEPRAALLGALGLLAFFRRRR